MTNAKVTLHTIKEACKKLSDRKHSARHNNQQIIDTYIEFSNTKIPVRQKFTDIACTTTQFGLKAIFLVYFSSRNYVQGELPSSSFFNYDFSESNEAYFDQLPSG